MYVYFSRSFPVTIMQKYRNRTTDFTKLESNIDAYVRCNINTRDDPHPSVKLVISRAGPTTSQIKHRRSSPHLHPRLIKRLTSFARCLADDAILRIMGAWIMGC